MTEETLLIVLIRLIVPLTIFRWPLAGGLLALLADALLDAVLASFIDLGGLWDYYRLDKYLDTYYLTIALIVAQRWEPLPRWTATALFAYRLIGVALFEATGIRPFLLLFPNLFEHFFLFYAVLLRFFPRYDLTERRLAMWLVILLIPKMAQEFVLHYARPLDDVVAADLIKDAWRTSTDWLRRLP